jgi:hypothetical protein
MADDSVYNTGSTITWLLPRRGVGQIKGGFSWLKGEQSSFQNVWGGQIGALLICGQVFLSPRDYRADHSSYLALGLLKFWFLSPLISYFSSNFIFWVVVGFEFTFFRVVSRAGFVRSRRRPPPLWAAHLFRPKDKQSNTHSWWTGGINFTFSAQKSPKADLIFNVQVYTTHMPIAGWAIPQRLTDRNPWKWLSSCTHQHTSILSPFV